MNKVAVYLNEHLMGEVMADKQSITANSLDGSPLLVKPEMVVNVASTNDIRKIMRFCWQLAEKGHALSVTPRGFGGNSVGSGLGTGIVISASKYMNRIVGIDPKQRLIHVQAGASLESANMTLSTHSGTMLPLTSYVESSSTIGGAISSGAAGFMSSRYGVFADSVKQLEVILANGDVLQTGRLSKREVNAKKGLHTFEGEIYRQVDNLISDNSELIDSIGKSASRSTVGYGSIAKVRKKDGSIDLTPLFFGSDGTLGIIAEAILQAQFARRNLSVTVVAYDTLSDAHAAMDTVLPTKAAAIELIDGRLVKRAADQGKAKDFAPKESYSGGLLVAIYDDFSERTRQRLTKKLQKELTKTTGHIKTSILELPLAEVAELHSILALAANPASSSEIVPGAFGGLWLPSVQIATFMAELKQLEKTLSIDLPLFVDLSSGFVDIMPVFDMKKITDRQKMLKSLSAVSDLVIKHNGSVAGYGGEGRIKSLVSSSKLSDQETELYQKIRHIFDPHNILNPTIKQQIAPKDIASQVNAWCQSVL